ncbi:MAG: MFS transporter, partial [Balneolaceae bacterium]
VLNSASYLLSGWFIYLAEIPQSEMSAAERHRTRNPLTGILEGFRFLQENRQVLRPALAKGTFTICSGALVYMLIIVAEEILLMGSIGLGLLYAARGVGTGVGPIFARRLFRSESGWVQVMGYCMVFSGICYFFVGQTSSLIWMLIFVMLAHMASGANWVMSTVLLQRRAPDVFRGRSFSTEWLLFTLSQSLSVTIASLILEFGWLTLQEAIGVYAVLLCGIGAFWLLKVAPEDTI